MVSNGSDEVLAHAFFAFFQHDAPLLMPDISYSFYQVYCHLYGIAVQTVPLTSAMGIDVSAYARPKTAGAVIANPNAPTGIGLGLRQDRAVAATAPAAGGAGGRGLCRFWR